jgi:hypothetical protein
MKKYSDIEYEYISFLFLKYAKEINDFENTPHRLQDAEDFRRSHYAEIPIDDNMFVESRNKQLFLTYNMKDCKIIKFVMNTPTPIWNEKTDDELKAILRDFIDHVELGKCADASDGISIDNEPVVYEKKEVTYF